MVTPVAVRLCLLLGVSVAALAAVRPAAAAHSAEQLTPAAVSARTNMALGDANTRQRTTALGQYTIRPQGNDSNCDFVAVHNGVQNIGGDGTGAYQLARALIPQRARDYHEGFYTRRGPNGSDLPFSLDNLGAAPDAFVGLYEALGYNAVVLAAVPGNADEKFAQAIYARLAANPQGTFAHLWLTSLPYKAARTITVEETGERVSLLYPYHEVIAFAAPEQPNQVVILDGQVRRPYRMALGRLARELRGFNRVVLVSRNDGSLVDHQRSQLQEAGRPYVAPPLGGAFLYAARQLWGPGYRTWGDAIGLPLRIGDGEHMTVMLPGEYVHYQRAGVGEVTLAPLGARMIQELEGQGLLAAPAQRAPAPASLPEGMRLWVEAQFGSAAAFEQVFGKPLTNEFWLSQEQMQGAVLRGLSHPVVSAAPLADGYVVLLTERAMVAWSPTQGTFLVPLGRVYHEQLKRAVGL